MRIRARVYAPQPLLQTWSIMTSALQLCVCGKRVKCDDIFSGGGGRARDARRARGPGRGSESFKKPPVRPPEMIAIFRTLISTQALILDFRLKLFQTAI